MTGILNRDAVWSRPERVPSSTTSYLWDTGQASEPHQVYVTVFKIGMITPTSQACTLTEMLMEHLIHPLGCYNSSINGTLIAMMIMILVAARSPSGQGQL